MIYVRNLNLREERKSNKAEKSEGKIEILFFLFLIEKITFSSK